MVNLFCFSASYTRRSKEEFSGVTKVTHTPRKGLLCIHSMPPSSTALKI